MKPNGVWPGDTMSNLEWITEDKALEVIRRSASSQIFPGDINLFRQGETLREIYLIEEGTVKMMRTEQDGKEITMEFRAAGRLLGAISVITGRPALMTAVTQERCRLACLPARTFLRLIRSEEWLASRLLEVVCEVYYEQVIRQAQNKLLPARARTAALLLQLIPERGQGRKTDLCLRLPTRHRDLAGFLMMTPSHFSRMLNELEAAGIICRHNGFITVTRPDLLRQEALVEKYGRD